MTRPRRALIDDLAADLAPVRSPGRTAGRALGWLAGGWLFVVAAILASAPLRPGAGAQLLASPRFLGETLLGVVAGGLAIAAALRLGIPQPGPLARRVAPALALLAAWAGAYFYGLWDPALEPSMLGKREGCYLQVLLYGAPPLAAGLWLARRLAPLSRAWTGALLGAAAGALPGVFMQLACMYIPEHILTHHVAPVLGLAVVGALLGPLALRRI
ncbi:MAG: NrsF family protein [Myxococcota bacterium]|nr:NrsF family protein [Myxococcota bacterium]